MLLLLLCATSLCEGVFVAAARSLAWTGALAAAQTHHADAALLRQAEMICSRLAT